MIVKCKMCGGDMELSADKRTGTCEYCGSTMTLPKIDDDQRAAAFNRGNHFRRIGEFDKALSVYESIVREDDKDAEAHWCCALCRFGIEYVKDPVSGEYLPTCHRASFDSFLEDVDYQAALEYADVVARRQYEKDAETIAQVQRGILSISQKEKPFDVFICYKESDENGNRTVDSTLAQDIYYQLTEQGHRVFFARITLEDKAGQEYEPYIFAALHSAKVMVVVGTKPEYLNAVWVKNEWSRYLSLMKNDRKRLLIPCYRDMDPYDLPEQLSVLQSYDMGKIGFIQDLIRGISKVLDAEKKPEVRERAVVSGDGINVTAQLQRGMMALEDEAWDEANDFFDRTLDMDAECAAAYFGKALASMECRDRTPFIEYWSSMEELSDEDLSTEEPEKLNIDGLELPSRYRIGEKLEACPKDTDRIEKAAEQYEIPGYLEKDEIRQLFEDNGIRDYISAASIRRIYQADWRAISQTENKNLVRAAKYARGEFAEYLQDTFQKIEENLDRKIKEAEERDRNEAERLRDAYAHFLELTEKLVEERNGLAKVCRDADILAKQVEEREAEEKREADYHAAAEAMKTAGTESAKWLEVITLLRASNLTGYRDVEQLLRQAEEKYRQTFAKEGRLKQQQRKKRLIIASTAAALAIICVAVYTMVISPSLKYKEAERLLAAGEYDAAVEAFTALGDYSDAAERTLELKYKAAEGLLAEGNYGAASEAFKALGEYLDASERVLEPYYIEAETLLNDGKYYEAIKAFEALGNYSDAADRVLETKYKAAEDLIASIGYWETVEIMADPDMAELLENNMILGDTVVFGSYEQDGNTENGSEKIEWMILEREGNQALLLSKYALDAKPYNTEEVDVTWETSTIREWLNDTFISNAFSDEEQSAIQTITVKNGVEQGYSGYDTHGGNDTQDKVFLLSYKEASNDYFTDYGARICKPTPYAEKRALYGIEGKCSWWLRSPGSHQDDAACVSPTSDHSNSSVDFDKICVRPALWINLDSDIF